MGITDKLISVVVPMYCEEEVAHVCYNRISMVLLNNHLNYELIFVNDGSKDKTLTIIEGIACIDRRVKIISLSRNFGHQVAITAGISRSEGDAVIVIDADMQDPPEVIPQMVELWQQGYEVVYAKRKKRKEESWFKLVTAKGFYKLLAWMTEVPIPQDTGDFRLMDRKVVDVFKQMPEKHRFVRGMVSWVGFKQTAVEYVRDGRLAGETKYPLKKMLRLASDGILSFSQKPLRLIGNAGLICTLAALLCLASYIILDKQLKISNSLLVMFIVTFLGGIQLMALGVVGGYIGRIYDQSLGRPLFIIDKEINDYKQIDLERIQQEDSIIEEQFI
jgi:polyisoprenyl-phosphate glycosyltransferase